MMYTLQSSCMLLMYRSIPCLNHTGKAKKNILEQQIMHIADLQLSISLFGFRRRMDDTNAVYALFKLTYINMCKVQHENQHTQDWNENNEIILTPYGIYTDSRAGLRIHTSGQCFIVTKVTLSPIRKVTTITVACLALSPTTRLGPYRFTYWRPLI